MDVSAAVGCLFRPIQGVSAKAPIQENFADTFSALVSAETYRPKQKCFGFRSYTTRESGGCPLQYTYRGDITFNRTLWHYSDRMELLGHPL